MGTVSRRELKYLMSRADSLRLQEELNMFLKRDSYSEQDYYMVRSLYFDSLNSVDYHEKLDGAQTRKKFRLRIYNLYQDMVKLECKQKENSYQRKTSLLISREDAAACIRGQYEVLLRYGDRAAEFYLLLMFGVYRPAAVITYQRRAYTFPAFNVRLTFDTDIQSCETAFDLWRCDLPMVPVLDAEHSILEVKYDHYLPESVKAILSGHHLTNVSFSKYANGRVLIGDCL